MDGINPTLAFAALFLGLSGHPRDVAEQPAEPEHTKNWESPGPADQQMGYLFDCPVVVAAVDDEDAPIASLDLDPLQDHKIALASSVLTLEPDMAEKPAMPSELSGDIFQDQDDCSELAPQP
jgi:hypothetical protein